MKKMHCGECGKGKYAPPTVNLNQFHNFPSDYGFKTSCQWMAGNNRMVPCHYSHGFMPVYTKGLVAGRREDANSKIEMHVTL